MLANAKSFHDDIDILYLAINNFMITVVAAVTPELNFYVILIHCVVCFFSLDSFFILRWHTVI